MSKQAETTPSPFCFRSPKVIAEQWEYTKEDEKVVYKRVEVFLSFIFIHFTVFNYYYYYHLLLLFLLLLLLLLLFFVFYVYCRLGIMAVDVFGYLTDETYRFCHSLSNTNTKSGSFNIRIICP